MFYSTEFMIAIAQYPIVNKNENTASAVKPNSIPDII